MNINELRFDNEINNKPTKYRIKTMKNSCFVMVKKAYKQKIIIFTPNFATPFCAQYAN